MNQPLKVGDTVYSLDDLQHGYHEEATITEVNEHVGRPDFAPARTYTVTTKSGGVLHSMMASELSRTPPKPRPSYAIANWAASLTHPIQLVGTVSAASFGLPQLDTYMDPTACSDRLWREYGKHGRLLVAVDYDSTCAPFPAGTTHDMVLALLRRCTALGFHLYLFTASNPSRYAEMHAFMAAQGIKVAPGVNVNPIELPFGNWGKPYWNVLVDDRAGLASAYQALLSVVERAEAANAHYPVALDGA